MIKVVIIGAGNVATHLYQNFTKSKQIDVVQVFSRDIQKLYFVKKASKKVSKIEELKEADLYLLAIKDEAIQEVASQLKSKSGVVAHTSGSVSMDIFSGNDNYGVFYPMQTFSKNKLVNFEDVPLCLEANTQKNLTFLKNIASIVSNRVFEVNSEQRKVLHISAVFVNNFTNHLFALASDFCKKEDLPFDMLRPLIKETVDKLDILDPYAAQTGPALRNDQKTIAAHLEMLDDNQSKIYTIITESIQNLHGKKL